MAEPASTAIGLLIWEYALKPTVDSIKKEYGDETKKLLKSGIKKAFGKLPFQKKELEIIETEIINTDIEVLTNQKKFLSFLENNRQINDVLVEVKNRNKNIDIKVEKGVGYIDIMNGDISF